MGVDYYKTAAINTFNLKKVDLIKQAQEEVNGLVQSEEFFEMSQEVIYRRLEIIRQGLITSLKSHLEAEIPKYHSPQPISSTMKFDKLTSPSVKKLDDGVMVTGVITGYSEAYSKVLDFDITFIVPELILGEEAGDGTDEGNNGIDNLYPDPIPTGLSSCTANKSEECIGDNNTSLQNKDNSTIYFPNGFSKSNGNLDFNTNRTTLYINSHFNVHNANNMNMSDSSFLVNGEFKVNQNSNNMNQSIIKVNGSFSVGQNMGNMNNSTIIVNGQFEVGQNMQNTTGSKICVNGSFKVDGI